MNSASARLARSRDPLAIVAVRIWVLLSSEQDVPRIVIRLAISKMDSCALPRGKSGESSKFCSAIEDDRASGRVFRDPMDVSWDLLLDQRSDEHDPCPGREQ